jgi:hypothetical protein
MAIYSGKDMPKEVGRMRSRSPRFMLSGTRPTKRSSGWTERMPNVIPV